MHPSSRFRCVIAALAACALTAAAPGGSAATDAAANLNSADAVKRLTTAMKERQLTAIAVKDPAAPDRFIAAMLFPGVQLLLVEGKSDSGAYVESLLASGDYAKAYATLHYGPADGRLFVQDMGADGLHGDAKHAADVVYRNGVDQYLLNGDHKAAGRSAEGYAALVKQLDEHYSRAVSRLVEAIHPGMIAPR